MKTPAELKYTESHEWVRNEADGTVTVGITDHAQEELGDLVFCGECALSFPTIMRVIDERQATGKVVLDVPGD